MKKYIKKIDEKGRISINKDLSKIFKNNLINLEFDLINSVIKLNKTDSLAHHL